MNKKLLLIAMLAIVGSASYANEISLEQRVEENRVIATQAQNNAAHAIIVNKKQDAEIAANTNKIDETNSKLDRVTENIYDNLDSVANGMDSLRQEIAKQDNKIEETSSELDRISENIYTNLEGVTDRMDALNQEMNKQDEQLNNKVDETNSKLNEVENNLYNGLTDANGRIDELNKEMVNSDTQLNNKIDANKAEQDKVNAAQKENNAAQQQAIENLQQDFSQYNGRLSGLENKVDNLDSKMNKGLSLMAAMTAVDFQNVEEGEMAIGAGVGHYGNAQSVAVGVAYSPVQNLNLNLKYSVTAGDVKSSAIGAGASYKFRVK